MLVSPSITSRSASAPVNGESPAWCADAGDGTYRNPVLFSDYSDPDAIRVGDDYWMTSSSFCHVPGLPILHSRDLVNWSLVNHALPQLVPVEHFSRPRHGGGVWAPSLRHHAGKFWIFYPDPDFGIYVVTADDPRGAWSAPVMVKAGRGLIDPCPFWDEDGTAWLIHGWAMSRAGVKNRLTLHRLDATSTGVADAGEVVIDGDRMEGWNTIEGPKLYKRAGYYYVFAPAGGVRDGYQAVFRARSLRGPYESRIVLAQGGTAINGPHQGAWVDTPKDEHWFLHFQEVPAYGRIVHLQPMRWEDNWPVMGNGDPRTGPGEPVITHRKPLAAPARAIAPALAGTTATSDDFRGTALAPHWQWQANPDADWFSLKPGALRLACVPQKPAATLWDAAHLLMQKFPAPEFVATTRVSFSAAAEGDRAGLVVFGFDYTWLGLRRERSGLRLVLINCAGSHQGGSEQLWMALDAPSASAWLRVSVSRGAECQFSYSFDGEKFFEVGPLFRATSSYWVGAKTGLFAAANADANGAAPRGFLEANCFRVTAR